MLNSPAARHHPVPLSAQDLVGRLIADFPPLQRSNPTRQQRTDDKNFLKRKSLESELERLQEFRRSALLQLQEVRAHWLEEINRATSEIEQIVKSKCEAISKELMQCISDLDDLAPSPDVSETIAALTHSAGESVLDLSIDLRPLDLSTLIKQFVSLSLDFTKPAQEKYLYKFFGGLGTVSYFDPGTEKIISTAKTPEKFLHNACWIAAPTGEIYITGGSLMGRSKDCALIFTTKEETIAALPSMKTPRRSHTSVYLCAKLWVFGGICDEQQLSLCESIAVNAEHWLALPPMKSARAYLGSTVYREKVYLAGGSDISGVEVYDPASNLFTFLPLAGLTEACSLIALEDSITILHGNTQGEALSFTPSDQECRRIAPVCHGFSWSNCPPLLYKDALYTLRSDSIFKLDMTTFKSNYVLWITKSGKKRRELDET
jgi:hypothetical protein